MTENIYTIKTSQFKVNMESKKNAFRTHMNTKTSEALKFIERVRK